MKDRQKESQRKKGKGKKGKQTLENKFFAVGQRTTLHR